MQRVLAILLTTAVLTTAVVPSAFACVRDNAAVGSQGGHDCCTAQIVPPASSATCCAVSQPVRDRAVTGPRTLRASSRHVDLALLRNATSFRVSDARLHAGAAGPPSSPTARAVPIYLQQHSLLI